jgi:hypothetical protein
MENKLALQALPLNEVMSMAQNFAESGMFTDAKQQAQAFVKIIAGQEIGIPPFAAMSGIHIIQGKPTVGAGLIASCVKGSGKYDYKVLQLDNAACSLDFYQGKEKLGNSTFTLEDAKKAQTKNLDKFPKNMLFARAISNGVKWYCPDVFSGPVYTPEEMNTIDISHEELQQPAGEPTAPQPKNLPVISDKAFDKLLTRYQAGEVGIVDTAKETYSFTQGQLDTIDGAVVTVLPVMSDEDFPVLIADLSLESKTGAMAMLKEKRTQFEFTKEQEAEINKAIVGLTSKKAA